MSKDKDKDYTIAGFYVRVIRYQTIMAVYTIFICLVE